MYATQWYQYIYTISIYFYLSYQPAGLSSWTNLKLINSPASAGEELLMPGAILLVPGCRSAADLFLEPGGYEFGGETPGFVKIRFGNLANLEDFDRQVGLNIICGVTHQILKVQRRIEMGLYPARQWKLTFSIRDLAATVWIGGAEILLSNLKDLAKNSDFSLNLPHCKKRWLFFDTKWANINPLIAPPPHLDIKETYSFSYWLLGDVNFNLFQSVFMFRPFSAAVYRFTQFTPKWGGPVRAEADNVLKPGVGRAQFTMIFPLVSIVGIEEGIYIYIVYYNYICVYIYYIYIWLVVWNMAFMTFHILGMS